MKSLMYTRLTLVLFLLLGVLGGTAVATLPSGNGQTTKAKSVSVAIASDQTVSILPPDRTTYTLAYLQGTLGGSALATDPDPNTTDPGSKAVRIGRDMIPTNLGAASIVASIADAGGSMAVQPWVYDDVRAKWFKFVGAPVTVSLVSAVATVGGGMAGAKFFMQITSNASSITQYWWFIR